MQHELSISNINSLDSSVNTVTSLRTERLGNGFQFSAGAKLILFSMLALALGLIQPHIKSVLGVLRWHYRTRGVKFPLHLHLVLSLGIRGTILPHPPPPPSSWYAD
jgi:hypothetical protein